MKKTMEKIKKKKKKKETTKKKTKKKKKTETTKKKIKKKKEDVNTVHDMSIIHRLFETGIIESFFVKLHISIKFYEN